MARIPRIGRAGAWHQDTEESAGWNTKKLPRKCSRSAKVCLFLRLLRFFAAIPLALHVVYATDLAVCLLLIGFVLFVLYRRRAKRPSVMA